ncbi:uncharacterized protein F5891DRAFT_1032012, partial [Suillus fuscotomentosus]
MGDADKITITSISEDEPLVGRRELWSYYREFRSICIDPCQAGPSLPEGEHHIRIGWKEVSHGCTEDIQASSLELCISLLTHRCTVRLTASSISFLQNTPLGLSQATTSTMSMKKMWGMIGIRTENFES